MDPHSTATLDCPASAALTAEAQVHRRILCAEDHLQMSELVEKVLTRAGHHVVCVEDGQRAIERLAHEAFDVLVTDHHMPNVSGLELVTQARQLGFTGKIVLHTSRLTPAEEEAYRALHVDAILMKPGGILKLPAIVQ